MRIATIRVEEIETSHAIIGKGEYGAPIPSALSVGLMYVRNDWKHPRQHSDDMQRLRARDQHEQDLCDSPSIGNGYVEAHICPQFLTRFCDGKPRHRSGTGNHPSNPTSPGIARAHSILAASKLVARWSHSRE